MPRYDYYCPTCELTTELQHSFNDKDPKICPDCGYIMVRQLSLPAIQFKGTGFYSTDNRK